MSELQHFTWSDALNTGVPAIDVQHKELIRAFNDLADAIEQNKGAPAVKKLLAFLKYYAEWHFGREEKCAADCQCPISDVNKKAHQHFYEAFGKLHEQYHQSESSDEIACQVHKELSDWIVNHVMKIDKQIGVSYQQQQEQEDDQEAKG